MGTILANPLAPLIMGVMIVLDALILFIRRLDTARDNGMFYAGMIGIVLLIGGTLLLKLLGG